MSKDNFSLVKAVEGGKKRFFQTDQENSAYPFFFVINCPTKHVTKIWAGNVSTRDQLTSELNINRKEMTKSFTSDKFAVN